MKNLQDATENICDLKGSVLSLNALLTAIVECMPAGERARLAQVFALNAEVARTVLLHAPISEHTIASFDRDTERLAALLVPA